jgi:hypothetical protein
MFIFCCWSRLWVCACNVTGRQPWPFGNSFFDYIRAVGPGVLVGQSWYGASTTKERSPHKYLGEFVLIRNFEKTTKLWQALNTVHEITNGLHISLCMLLSQCISCCICYLTLRIMRMAYLRCWVFLMCYLVDNLESAVWYGMSLNINNRSMFLVTVNLRTSDWEREV